MQIANWEIPGNQSLAPQSLTCTYHHPPGCCHPSCHWELLLWNKIWHVKVLTLISRHFKQGVGYNISIFHFWSMGWNFQSSTAWTELTQCVSDSQLTGIVLVMTNICADPFSYLSIWISAKVFDHAQILTIKKMNELEYCRCEYRRLQRDMLGHLSSASMCEITGSHFKDMMMRMMIGEI